MQNKEAVLEIIPFSYLLHQYAQNSLNTQRKAHIRLLGDRFGNLVNDDMEAVLKGYLPKDVHPYKFQIDAATLCMQVMHQHGGFLLGDVVGLGKTIVGVLVLKYYLDTAEDEGRAHRVLVIVPRVIIALRARLRELFSQAKLGNIDRLYFYFFLLFSKKNINFAADLIFGTMYGGFRLPELIGNQVKILSSPAAVILRYTLRYIIFL